MCKTNVLFSTYNLAKNYASLARFLRLHGIIFLFCKFKRGNRPVPQQTTNTNDTINTNNDHRKIKFFSLSLVCQTLFLLISLSLQLHCLRMNCMRNRCWYQQVSYVTRCCLLVQSRVIFPFQSKPNHKCNQLHVSNAKDQNNNTTLSRSLCFFSPFFSFPFCGCYCPIIGFMLKMICMLPCCVSSERICVCKWAVCHAVTIPFNSYSLSCGGMVNNENSTIPRKL